MSLSFKVLTETAMIIQSFDTIGHFKYNTTCNLSLGTCIDELLDFTCICPEERKGKSCDKCKYFP